MSDVNINIRLVTAAAQAQAKQLQTSLAGIDTQTKKTNDSFKGFGSTLGNVGSIAKGVFVGNLFVSALNLIASAVRDTTFAFVEYEAQLVSVGKTTGIEGKELSALGDSFQELAKIIPVTSEELTNIGIIAGQLGINSSKDIVKFTETIARLGISAEGASVQDFAQQLARIAGLTKLPISSIDRLSSSLVDLGNNVKANEGQITAVALEVSKAGAAYDLSAQDVVGFSATLAELGISAELGGSATLRILRSITDATSKGGDQLDEYIKLTGLTVEQFRDLAKNSPLDVVTKLSKGLNQLSEVSVADANKSLEILNLNELRAAKVVSALSKQYQELEINLNRGRTAFDDNTAAIIESDKQAETAKSGIQLLSNSFTIFAQNISESLTPAINAAARALSEDFNEAALKVQSTLDGSRGRIAQIKLELAALEKTLNANGNALQRVGNDLVVVQVNTDGLVERQKKLNEELGLLTGKLTEADVQYRKAQESVKLLAEEEEDLQRIINDDNTAEFIKEQQRQRLEIVRKRQQDELRFIAAFESSKKSLESGGVDGENPNEKLVQQLTEAQQIRAQFDQQKKERELFDIQEKAAIEDFVRTNDLAKLEQFYIDQETLRQADKLAAEKVASEKEKIINDIAIKAAVKTLKQKDRIDDLELKGKRQINDDLNELGKAGAKEAFAIQKAIAVQEAILASESAQLSAIAFGTKIGGPPLGAIFGIISKVATAARVANIVSAKAPSFQNGGIVPGNSFSGDNVDARVNSGEVILNRQQQAQTLFAIANGQGSSGGNESNREMVINTTVELDGETVARAVSRQVADGFKLGENQ